MLLFMAGAALLIANIVAFALFGVDKRRARQGRRRLPEGTLLLWALAGGTPGALAGRRVFHHKTRKQPFSRLLWLIALAQASAIATWALL